MNFLKHSLLLSTSLLLGIQGTWAMEHEEDKKITKTVGQQPPSNSEDLLSTTILVRTVQELQQTVQVLQLQVKQLTQKNNELQDKLNPSKPLKAIFRNDHKNTWQKTPHTDKDHWAPITFEIFEGDERLRGNLSAIEIPEDGFYSLFVHYHWSADNSGPAYPMTGISINRPDECIHAEAQSWDNNPHNNRNNYFVHHDISAGHYVCDGFNRMTRLKKGDKVMAAICGYPNALLCLGRFQFDIEKIN